MLMRGADVKKPRTDPGLLGIQVDYFFPAL